MKMKKNKGYVPKKRKGYVGRRLRESWQWYMLLLPALIYLLVFAYEPMYGVTIAFKNYRASKGIIDSPWIGFEHFIRFFQYPAFWKLIRNTLSITLLSLATFPAGILFALYLNELRQLRYKKVVQMITYMPHFLSEVVVCAMIIIFLDRTVGPINNMVAFFGGERVNFLGVPKAFSLIYVISGLWQNLGWESILYISALSAVSQDQIEAAKIDGASRRQIMWKINLPCISPTIIIMFLLRVGKLMTVGFSKILLLQNDLNLDYSSVISTYTYQVGLAGGQFSYATAIGLFNNVVNIIILLIVNAIVKRVSENSLF